MEHMHVRQNTKHIFELINGYIKMVKMGLKQLQIVENHISTNMAKTASMITFSGHDQTWHWQMT